MGEEMSQTSTLLHFAPKAFRDIANLANIITCSYYGDDGGDMGGGMDDMGGGDF